MKKFKIVSIILLALVVASGVMFAGCDLLGHTHKYPNEHQKNEEGHWKVCQICNYATAEMPHDYDEWVVDVPATETSVGHKYRECTVCGYTQEGTIKRLGAQQSGTVDLYAINDFHGEYEKLSQISGYIAERLAEGNTVALNSGDMFQGSIQSNSNYGRLFTECMNIAGFDAFTYGNHEFDWGIDNLIDLKKSSKVPFLGANIYKWNQNSKTWGGFADDLAEEYVIKELDNGLRVGIIGVIGKDQIKSISSQLVQTIGFKDPKDIVPNLSNKLRNQLACDVVVVDAHTGPSTFLDDSSWDITDYADAVFCAHTHYSEMSMKNGVPFIQGGSSGKYVSHVQLTVEENGNVSCDGYSNIAYSSLNSVNSYIKEQVQMNIDNSNERIAEEAEEKIVKLNGYLSKNEALPRLVCHAIAEYVASQNITIDVAMCNEARAYLGSDSRVVDVTYTELYKALPFDNVIYIARVSGRDLINEAKYNSMWRVSTKAIENSNTKYYTIAVIDYMLFHQNASRDYNYFQSAFNNGVAPYAVTKSGVDLYHYRLITRDFMKAQGTINASLYSETNNHTDANKLTQAVTF